MRVAAVIGSPVGHSLSPVIHAAGFRSIGVDWMFVAFEVAPGGGAGALDAMRVLGIGGLSVTTPHKEDVAGAVDVLAPAARVLRSVNTVAVGDDGALVGHSTDGDGFVASLRDAAIGVDGATIVVLGAGGAARSVVDALGRAGAADIVIVNRSADRAAATVALTERARVGVVGDVSGADIVVNATSVGFGTDELPVDPDLLRRGQVVADLVYHPLETALLRAAAGVGCRTVDGLGMLIALCRLQEVLWTGRDPDPVVMRAAARAELDRRR